MENPYQVLPDTTILPAHFPVPGMGVLPINAFVIKAKEPVLIDTGIGVDSEMFLGALKSIIDPRDLKWIWITHDDADHTGNLRKVLEVAPNARLAANSLAVLRMSTVAPLPMDRVNWLNSGDSLWVGDRTLTAVRPPLFDNPTTIGVYDDKSDAFFSADFFGAIIASAVKDAGDIADTDLAQGMMNWASGDNPWVHMVDQSIYTKALARIRDMNPKFIFSAHLPPAKGKIEQFITSLAAVPTSTPFTAPAQKELDQLLAQMKEGE